MMQPVSTDSRTPARQLVDAVLALVGAVPANATRDRGHNRATTFGSPMHPAHDTATLTLPGHVALWVAVIEDALQSAFRIASGGLPIGLSKSMGRKAVPRRVEQEREDLLAWATSDEDRTGSLRWIAAHLGISDGVVEVIEKRVVELLAPAGLSRRAAA